MQRPEPPSPPSGQHSSSVRQICVGHAALHVAEPATATEGKSWQQMPPRAQSALSSQSRRNPPHVEFGGLQTSRTPPSAGVTQQKYPWLTSHGAPLHVTDPGVLGGWPASGAGEAASSGGVVDASPPGGVPASPGGLEPPSPAGPDASSIGGIFIAESGAIFIPESGNDFCAASSEASTVAAAAATPLPVPEGSGAALQPVKANGASAVRGNSHADVATFLVIEDPPPPVENASARERDRFLKTPLRTREYAQFVVLFGRRPAIGLQAPNVPTFPSATLSRDARRLARRRAPRHRRPRRVVRPGAWGPDRGVLRLCGR